MWPLKKIFTFGNQRPRRLCYAVGLYTIGYGIFDMSYASVAHNARDPVSLKQRYGAGSWVVVTGVNDPLGAAMARRFAKSGFKLYLLDTEEPKIKDELSGLSEIKSKVFDFESADDYKLYEELCNQIKSETGDISVLVNNIGRKDPHGDRF